MMYSEKYRDVIARTIEEKPRGIALIADKSEQRRAIKNDVREWLNKGNKIKRFGRL